MKTTVRALLVAAIASASLAAWSFDLSGPWMLKIENLDHKVVASMTVRFLEADARSCIGGSWRQLLVESRTTTDPGFFPVADPLSYRVEEGSLTIGRNEVCDAYLHLSGTLGPLPMRGDYGGFGLSGGSRRGYFSLDRAP